ncbi:reverse transcriptase domain-containing protein [Tanacetum coccineum]
MPNYGKFLKELVSNKHKLEKISAAFLSDESFALIQNKVPPKLGDPGSFLIPCNFNKAFLCDALAYLGASVNLMPYSLYAKLYLKTLKPIRMSVRLADRSFQYPIRIYENMLVEVGKFTFHVDFVILEMKEDSKVPFILGRPFLYTADVAMKLTKKRLTLSLNFYRPLMSKALEVSLGHASFYRRFIKYFSKITHPLTKLLKKETSFEFNDECHQAFNAINEKLTCTPVIISPNWNLPFELMCDASEFAVGAVLEFDIEIKDKKGAENVSADHLSRIENDETSTDNEVDDNFPGETLMEITTKDKTMVRRLCKLFDSPHIEGNVQLKCGGGVE